MTRQEIVQQLQANADGLRAQFDLRRLDLFGSAARDELRPESDIDVLVEFNGRATFDRYMDLKFHLEEMLGRDVDLVTNKAIRKELRPAIERDLVNVA